jgi:hypothetical protein
MIAPFINMLASISALIVGGLIGVGFGIVQDAARRRYERKQQEGNFNSGWSVIPGSGARVGYLLMTLVLIQVICPLLFRDGIQWWVSGGVGLGYGVMLFRQLREKMSANK